MELWPYHAFGYLTAGREPAVMVTDTLVLLVAGVRLILANVETDAQVFVGALTPGYTVSMQVGRLGRGSVRGRQVGQTDLSRNRFPDHTVVRALLSAWRVPAG